jgi:hypothetical protein
MHNPIAKAFLDHPNSVGESYFEHQMFALRFAGRLFMAASAALIHAFLPFAFESTASRSIMQMSEEIAARRRAPATH